MAYKPLLNDTPINLVKRYSQVLRENQVDYQDMFLFGSYAKGTAKAWSDVDVCVVSKDFGKDAFGEMVMLKKLTRKVDTMIEPVAFHPDDLKDPYDPLAAEVRNFGIRV